MLFHHLVGIRYGRHLVDALKELQGCPVVQADAGNGLAVFFCLFGTLFNDLLIFCAERLPHLVIGSQEQGIEGVVPVCVVLVPGPELEIYIDAVGGVFLAVNNALLEAGDGLRPVDGLGIGSQGRECVVEDGGAADTNLHAGHVSRLGDGALARGELAVAVLAPADKDNACLFNGSFQHFTGLASFNGIDCLVAVRIVGHKKGQVCQVKFLNLGRPVDGGSQGKVNGTAAYQHEFRVLLAGGELGSGVHLDIDAAVGLFADQIDKIGCGHAPAGSGVGNYAQLVFLLVGGKGLACTKAEGHHSPEGSMEKAFHRYTPENCH